MTVDAADEEQVPPRDSASCWELSRSVASFPAPAAGVSTVGELLAVAVQPLWLLQHGDLCVRLGGWQGWQRAACVARLRVCSCRVESLVCLPGSTQCCTGARRHKGWCAVAAVGWKGAQGARVSRFKCGPVSLPITMRVTCHGAGPQMRQPCRRQHAYKQLQPMQWPYSCCTARACCLLQCLELRAPCTMYAPRIKAGNLFGNLLFG